MIDDLDDAVVTESVSASRSKMMADAHADATARGADCRRCPLFGSRQGPVPSEVRVASLVAIGEAPGVTEVRSGRPFDPHGKSGEQYEAGLRQGGRSRDSVATLNAIECRPPEELQRYERRLRSERGTDVATPTDCCLPRLKHDLESAQASVILTMGKAALAAVGAIYGIAVGAKGRKQVRGERRIASIKAQRGHPFELPDGKVLMPTLHPAFALRDERHMLHVIRDDIETACRISERGSLSWPEARHRHITPDIETIERICIAMIESGATIMVDIETDSLDTNTCRIRCVGLGAYLDGNTEAGSETIISIPFRHCDGSEYWSDLLHKTRAAIACRSVLCQSPLAFQNGQYDTRVLLRSGLMIDPRKTWFDTMIAHHDSRENDCKHDLAFISSRVSRESRLWKLDVDHKALENEDRFEDLCLYNTIDVQEQLRAMIELDKWIDRDGTRDQFEVDTRLAVIARDMSSLGIPVDLRERDSIKAQLTGWTRDLESSLMSCVGSSMSEYNPRSNVQTARWLYKVKGYVPRVSTGGHDYVPGEDPSVSIPAMIALLDAGVDAVTSRFIEAMIMHRSLEKLRSSYVDNLELEEVPGWSGLGLLRCDFHMHVVPSGRMSSSPNIQNWPSTGRINMKRMLVAPPGHVVVGADFDQLEARLYASASGDRVMLRAIAEGLDLHALNAATLFAKSDSDVESTYAKIVGMKKSTDETQQKKAKFLRLIAKRFVFLEVYGGEEDKLLSTMRGDRDKATGKRTFPALTPDQVSQWHEAFHRFHPECKQWQRAITRAVSEHGFVAEPIHHRRRFFPDGASKKNAPINHTIQAKASAIANRALLQIAAKIRFREWSYWSGIANLIHDQILVFVPESKASEATEILREAMTSMEYGVPITAEVVVSKNCAKQ